LSIPVTADRLSARPESGHPRVTDGRDAHMPADLVAWSDSRGLEPEGVISVNLADATREEMGKKFS